jgi:cephalosporin hydroxylase
MLKKILNKVKGRDKQADDPAKNPDSSEFEVNNWIISEFVVEHLVPAVGVHPFPLNELMLMCAAVCRFKPALIFEWGTNIGKSARIFHEITKRFGIRSEIHSIDLPDHVFHNEHPQKDRGIMVRGIPEVTLHQADGLQKSMEIIQQKKVSGSILFFVDGDHSYQSVKNELTSILRNVPNAVILLHDTFYQSADAGYNTGPHDAIKEVLGSFAGYQTLSTNMGLPGMTLVYRKK